MLKAIILDDEKIVLQGLQMIIDWEKFGIELAGTASDGLEGLRLFHEIKPEIIITDIRMPGMDGLELIEQIMNEELHTACIVFSGFNEVNYLKKAIKLGVIDYLEKPVTPSLFEDVLLRTIKKIKEQKRVERLQAEWEGSKLELLEKTTLDLLFLGEEAEEKWVSVFGNDATRIRAISVLSLSEDWGNRVQHPDYHFVYIRNGHERLIVVFHFEEKEHETLEHLIELPEKMTIGKGRKYHHLKDAKKSYQDAQHALRYGLYMDEGGWINFEDIGENTSLPRNLSELEKSIIFRIRTGDEGGLLSDLEQFIQELESQKLNPNLLENEVLKLIYLAQEIAKETGTNIHLLKDGGYYPQQELRVIQTKEQLFDWLYEQIDLIMKWILRVRTAENHGAVSRACAYLESKFDQDISLQEVAMYVGMNSTYFSLLFKETLGKSYIKYLTHIRMEKAKELLMAGGKVKDVSEKVGYHSYSHFSEVFKKYTGVKPRQYKESRM
jgi:two-component system, response regulator YesN